MFMAGEEDWCPRAGTEVEVKFRPITWIAVSEEKGWGCLLSVFRGWGVKVSRSGHVLLRGA